MSGEYILETQLTTLILHGCGRLVVLSDSDEVLAQAAREEWESDEWLTHTNWFRVSDHIKCMVYGDPSTASDRVARKIIEFLRAQWIQVRQNETKWRDKTILGLLDQMHEGIFSMISYRKWDV